MLRCRLPAALAASALLAVTLPAHAQDQAKVRAWQSFLTQAVEAAPDDFASLRGAKIGDRSYAVAVKLDPRILSRCVLGAVLEVPYLWCTIAGSSDLDDLLNAVKAAVPPGFVAKYIANGHDPGVGTKPHVGIWKGPNDIVIEINPTHKEPRTYWLLVQECRAC